MTLNSIGGSADQLMGETAIELTMKLKEKVAILKIERLIPKQVTPEEWMTPEYNRMDNLEVISAIVSS